MNTTPRHPDATAEAPYTVNIWCSRPYENDDCGTGRNYTTLAEARAAFSAPEETFQNSAGYLFLIEGYWLELDGPDVHEERILRRGEPGVCPRKQTRLDDGWASERLWEARMLYGIEPEEV